MRATVPGIAHSQILLEPQVLQAPVALSVDRIASIDRLRILAAVGIVWFHTEGAPYRQIGYAGLPIFLLIFFSLIARQPHPGTTGSFLKRRYNRLLRPWLFWSAVYGLCRLAKALHAMDFPQLREMFAIQTLVAGASIHLWYLPYAFASGLLVYALSRRTLKANPLIVVPAAAIVGMLTLAACAFGMARYELPSPLAQWEFALPAIPLGLAIGKSLSIQSRTLRNGLLAAICLAVLIVGWVLHFFGLGDMAIPYGIAIAAVCIAYYWETSNDTVVATLAPLTFGVYLIHPLVNYALRTTLPTTLHCGLFIALTAGISALITLVLMRTPVRRFL